MLIDEQECIARTKRVIEIMGGVAVVAAVVGRSKGRVYSWTYPKAHHGTGGLIPAECQIVLLQNARRTGKPLAPADFFPPDDRGEEAA